MARWTLIIGQSFVLRPNVFLCHGRHSTKSSQIPGGLETSQSTDFAVTTLCVVNFPFSGFRMWNWVISTVRKGACLWKCTSSHFECLNSGMWYHMQNRANLQKYWKKTKQINCSQTTTENAEDKFPTFDNADGLWYVGNIGQKSTWINVNYTQKAG